MNIGIFETQHFEGAYPMIRILDLPGNRLTIFVNAETYKRFQDLFGKDMKRYEWVVQRESISNRQFIFTLYKKCKQNQVQLLFLNTVSANFIYYGWISKLLRPARVILTLHDANSFLHSGFSLNFRRTVRHIGKKVLSNYCSAYSTVSETVHQYLVNRLKLKKTVHCIPGAVFEWHEKTARTYEQGELFRIVVPGSIDKRRRNYESIFLLLEMINEQSLPICIILAGGPYGNYGKEILQRCWEYSKHHKNLKFFEEEVLDQAIFDNELQQSHAVWIPSAINTIIADGIEETYGLTKSSGNIFDTIRHARPMLVPFGLAIEPALESSSYTYSDISSLLTFLGLRITNPSSYNEWASKARENSNYYTVENIRSRLIDLL